MQELIEKHDFVEFYVGRNGEFDELAASLVKLVQKANKDRNCAMTSLTLVLPYPVKDMEYYEKYYDDVIIYEAEEKPHFKRAITERNRFMIDRRLSGTIENKRNPASSAARTICLIEAMKKSADQKK